jgi:hypothetical protein
MSNDNSQPVSPSPLEDQDLQGDVASNEDMTEPLDTEIGSQLPPVEAPSSAFLLQLFLIPMIIVSIVVMVWLMFSWLAHLGSDPRDLVRDLGSLNKSSWQKAWTLSNLLRNADNDDLKDDQDLADELIRVLEKELEGGGLHPSRIRLRIFLCHCLGEFRLQTSLPTLLKAATLDRDQSELDVRLAALESLAKMAQNVGPEKVRESDVLIDTLLTISRLREDNPELQHRNEIRSTAAYTLGVIGGKRSLDRLAQMTHDSYTNSRFNAATGLARYGDPRAVDVLLQMLDPDEEFVVAGEKTPEAEVNKRSSVIRNGIRATALYSQNGGTEKMKSLLAALQHLESSDLPMAIRLQAKETLLKIRE